MCVYVAVYQVLFSVSVVVVKLHLGCRTENSLLLSTDSVLFRSLFWVATKRWVYMQSMKEDPEKAGISWNVLH